MQDILDTAAASCASWLLHITICDLVVGHGLALFPFVCAWKPTHSLVSVPHKADAVDSESEVLRASIPLNVLLQVAWVATQARAPCWRNQTDTERLQLVVEADYGVIVEVPDRDQTLVTIEELIRSSWCIAHLAHYNGGGEQAKSSRHFA